MIKNKIKLSLLGSVFFLHSASLCFAMDDEDVEKIHEAAKKLNEKIKTYKEKIDKTLEETVKLSPDETLSKKEQEGEQEKVRSLVNDYVKKAPSLERRIAPETLGSLGAIMFFDHINKKKCPLIWCSREEWVTLRDGELKSYLRYLRWKEMAPILFDD